MPRCWPRRGSPRDRVWGRWRAATAIGRHLGDRQHHGRRDRVRCAAEAVRAGAGVRHRKRAARPMRPVRTRSRWPPCGGAGPGSRSRGPRGGLAGGLMGMLADRRDRAGAGGPAPRRYQPTGCTGCCWNCCPAGHKFLFRPAGPGRCSHRSSRGTSPARPPAARCRADRRARGDRSRRPGPWTRSSPGWSPPRVHPDGPARHRALRRRPAARRRRRRPPGFASRDRFAFLERPPPRWDASFRQPGPATGFLPRREPAHQPGPCAHHGGRPAAAPRPSGRASLRRPPGRRDAVHDGHAGPETAAVLNVVFAPHARRSETTRSGPGRATGDAC